MIQIGVLALQGAFIEHEQMLSKLGISSFEIRQKKDLEIPIDGQMCIRDRDSTDSTVDSLHMPLRR